MHISPTLLPTFRRDEQLEGLLIRRLGNRIRDLRVVEQGSGIVLQGRTDTYHARELAHQTAEELTAFPCIVNDIEIR